MEYNSDEEPKITNTEIFQKTNSDLQNSAQSETTREEQNIVPKIRIEVATPTPNKNLIRNYPTEQIIGSKDKGVMTRRKINEELCFSSRTKK